MITVQQSAGPILFCFCIMLILAKYNGSDLFLIMNMQMYYLPKYKKRMTDNNPLFYSYC